MCNRILSAVFATLVSLSALANEPAGNNAPSIPLLRLKMALDSFNYDDIAIGFLASATTAYNNQMDSRYLPGMDAPEGLSSISSDNVKLSINIVPLPGQAPLVIRLDVEAKNSGPFTMLRTELDSISQVYDIWLMDKYTKDSLDLRSNTSYAFNVNKNDTASFGANRFTVIIRQKPAMQAHLLGFDVTKTASGNELSWTTENELDGAVFWAERSIDNGQTFVGLDSVRSTGTGAYNYTDRNPLNGADMYRVKMRDANGVVTYSNTVSIGEEAQPAKQDNALSIYPNPSNGPINLTINEPGSTPSSNTTGLQSSAINQKFAAGNPAASAYTIKIVNMKGSVVRSAVSSSSSWQDNLSSLSPGTYIVQVVNAADNKLVGKSTFVKL